MEQPSPIVKRIGKLLGYAILEYEDHKAGRHVSTAASSSEHIMYLTNLHTRYMQLLSEDPTLRRISRVYTALILKAAAGEEL